jgi:hypothetical protein
MHLFRHADSCKSWSSPQKNDAFRSDFVWQQIFQRGEGAGGYRHSFSSKQGWTNAIFRHSKSAGSGCRYQLRAAGGDEVQLRVVGFQRLFLPCTLGTLFHFVEPQGKASAFLAVPLHGDTSSIPPGLCARPGKPGRSKSPPGGMEKTTTAGRGVQRVNIRIGKQTPG